MKVSWKWPALSIMAVGIGYFSLTVFNKDTAQPTVELQKQEPQRMPAAARAVEDSKQIKSESMAKTKLAASQTDFFPKIELVQNFKVIQTKVFKSDEDQKKMKQIISDSSYLLQLATYLNNIQNLESEDFKANQNAVTDLLVEALKQGDSATAEKVILDIIKDPQVENENIPLEAREILGGFKAELLYQSSAIKPELSEQFERALPGPVSQRIWKNVQQQQADNLELSEDEIQARVAQKSQ